MEQKVIEALCDKLQNQESEKRPEPSQSPINNSAKAVVRMDVSNHSSPDRISLRSNPRNYTSNSGPGQDEPVGGSF